MWLPRLLLLLLAGFFIRRLFRSLTRRPAPPRAARDEAETKTPGESFDELTQQDISDADYDEIP